ncbi:MAG: hypothetical protein HY563_08370 [Ignavibacteriales bacterium]|nr:hypothetical protein [Ignavibacteriales bacterium]
MDSREIHCEHACRETCAMLKKALRLEENLLEFYRQVHAECDYPDIQAFLTDLIDRHKTASDRVAEKLSEMRARGETLDGVMASFDPAGC